MPAAALKACRAPSGASLRRLTHSWIIAQGLSLYNDIAGVSTLLPLGNLLFSFWFAPLAMALFLDPEHDRGRLDALMVLDFTQGVLVCIAAYLYFFYIPKAESPSELSHTVWIPYFGGYGLVAAAFILRAVVSRSRDVRWLFGPMGLFLALIRMRGRAFLLRPGKRFENGTVVRSAVERATDSADDHRCQLEAGRSAGDRA